MGEALKIKVGGWTARPALNRLERNGRSIHIDPRAMEVLVYLANHAGEVVSANELITAVWQGRVVEDHSVYQIIKRLRKAFGDDFHAPRFIQTVPKRGYRLTAPVHILPPEVRGQIWLQRLFPHRWQQAAVLLCGLSVMTISLYVVSSWSFLRTADQLNTQTIAVLPFADLGSNDGDEYLGEGIADDIIHALSNGSGLRVVARTSSFSFKGTSADIREIGERLGASVILEGSVRPENGHLRIVVQLVESKSGHHIWSESFTKPMTELHTVQRDIAVAVAARLMGEDADVGRMVAALPPIVDISAYEYYVLGRQRMRNPSGFSRFWSAADADRAIEYFRRAIAVDPSFARAYAGLAEALLRRTVIGVDFVGVGEVRQAVREEAMAAIDQALALDPELAEAHASRAFAFRLLDEDFERAEEAYRRAIALNPNLADPHFRLGIQLEDDFPEEGEAEFRTAIRLDPMSPGIHLWLGGLLDRLERYEEAVAVFRAAVQLDPDSSDANLWLGRSLNAVGRHQEAAPYFEQARLLERPHVGAFIQSAYNRRSLGRPDQAIRILQPLLGNPEYRDRQLQIQAEIARLYLELNDFETAEEVLEPIEQSEEASNVRIQLALAQGRIQSAVDLTHAKESRDLMALYEMVIGHDDHARELFEEIASERDLSSLKGSFKWGYHPAINAAHLYLKDGGAEIAAVMLETSRRALNPALEDQYTAGGAYYLLASIHAIEGSIEDALAALEEAIARGWTRHWYAVRDPNLERLWAEPRFQTMIADVRVEMDHLRLEMQVLVAAE